MTLGFENRKKAIAVGALVLFAVVVVVWELWPASTTSAAVTASPAVHPTANVAVAKKGAAPPSTLDPTLRYDWLKASEDTKYAGSGKNIFVAAPEAIPQPVAPAVISPQNVAPQGPPPIPPPPPINLKFYGFATKRGDTKKVFLSEGDDIFIAGEGDIVDRRYKVIRIMPMAVEIEDVLNNNRQQIPLTQS